MKDFLIICLRSFITTLLVMFLEIILFNNIDETFILLIFILNFTSFAIQKMKED